MSASRTLSSGFAGAWRKAFDTASVIMNDRRRKYITS
jgi:hypothetical protein